MALFHRVNIHLLIDRTFLRWVFCVAVAFLHVPAYRPSRTHCSLFQEKHISQDMLAAQGSRIPSYKCLNDETIYLCYKGSVKQPSPSWAILCVSLGHTAGKWQSWDSHAGLSQAGQVVCALIRPLIVLDFYLPGVLRCDMVPSPGIRATTSFSVYW